VSVARENARPGTTEWWQAPWSPPGAIEGYARQPSLVAGDALGLCVATRPAARYAGAVYRLGWYGGAGGRRVGVLDDNVGLVRHAALPDPSTGRLDAGWPVTDTVRSDESWVSGQYVAVLTLRDGPHAGSATRIPFVITALPGERAPVLVQTPVNTAQAYNHWGGRSLYPSNSLDGLSAVKVSFDRPMAAWQEANLNARAPFVYELALVRWLEREGLELDYQTDVDTHRHPHTLAGRRLIVVAGHDEYWTATMREATELALADGSNLAFMGANIGYWQARYEDEERTLVVFRDAARDPVSDPSQATVRFRDLQPPRPERGLIGVQYEGGLGSDGRPGAFQFSPAFAEDRWAAGVELDPTRPLQGLVGYEWDTLDAATAPPGATIILHADLPPAPAHCLRWTAPSGARVLAAGSLGLVWGLDDWPAPSRADARLQAVLGAAFRELSA
jgi:hypothetical protein